MDYPGGMMPYPPQGGNSAPRFSHKSRGQKNNAYRFKKHHRYPSNEDMPNMCFNCGSPDHWAQHCPEPRREPYPGDMPYSNPPKRQKTHRFNSGQYRGGPQFPPQDPYEYPPLPMTQADYDHMPMDPAYDQSPPSYGRWQQGPPPRKRYSYPQYPPHDVPPPMPGYGPQFSGPPGPPPPPHHRGYYPPEYPPGPAEGDRHPYPPDYHQHPPQDRRHRQPSKTWKRPENARGPMPPPEPWANEFGPSDNFEPQTVDGQIVWKPAMEVARPLPSTLDDRDEISSLPPISSLPRGMSVSKYILNRPPEDFQCNIRETEDWPFMMSDPIFSSIPAGGEMISWQNLVARRNKSFETHRVPKTQSVQDVDDERGAKSESDFPAGENGYDSDPRGPDAEYDSPSVSDRQSATSPVHSPARNDVPETYNDLPYKSGASSPAMESEQPGLKDENDAYFSGGLDSDDTETNPRTPRRFAAQDHNQSLHPDKGEQRQYNNGECIVKDQQQPFERRFKPTKSSRSQPRRFMKAGSSDGASAENSGRKGSDAATNVNVENSMDDDSREGSKASGALQEAGNDLTNGARQHSNKGASSQGQSDHASHKHPESGARLPAKSDSELKRQKDDITPKIKRRQPQVADVYSRRW